MIDGMYLAVPFVYFVSCLDGPFLLSFAFDCHRSIRCCQLWLCREVLVGGQLALHG